MNQYWLPRQHRSPQKSGFTQLGTFLFGTVLWLLGLDVIGRTHPLLRFQAGMLAIIHSAVGQEAKDTPDLPEPFAREILHTGAFLELPRR